MAKANVVTPEMWTKIKTEYEFGRAVTQIAKEFKIAHTTILRKAKKCGWTHAVHATKLAEAQQIFASVHNSVHREQQPLVRAKFLSMIERQELVNNFIDGAISLNLKNMQAAHAEQDPEKRIKLTQQMKATMVDLASVGQIIPTLKQSSPADDSEEESVVKIYIPDNGRD